MLRFDLKERKRKESKSRLIKQVWSCTDFEPIGHLEGMLIFIWWNVLAGMDYWTGLPGPGSQELWCSTQRCYCNIGLYFTSHAWMLSIYFHKIHQNLSFKGLFIKMFFQGSIPLDPAWQLCWSGHISWLRGPLTSQKKKSSGSGFFSTITPGFWVT